MAREEIVFDAWTPVSFKRALDQKQARWEAPSWIPEEHWRRLQAYKILAAYRDNAARVFLATDDEEKKANHREYGDAALVVEATRAALIGSSQTITVPGAEDFDPDLEGDSEEQADNREAEEALERQEMLQEWGDLERFPLKLVECERDSVGLGDGIYVLGWSNSKERPRLRVFDPGFYFPAIDDRNDDDFPNTVHIAWELPPEEGSDKTRIRRITYRLGPIMPRGEGGPPRVGEDGRPIMPEDEGMPTRQYPWNERPSQLTCYMTDAVFTVSSMDRTLLDFSPEAADYMLNDEGTPIRDLDLEIDFIPVVHVPNSISLKEHYGRSTLAWVLQILDDLAATDTDLQAAAATAAGPVIAVAGFAFEREKDSGEIFGQRRAPSALTYGPNTVFEMPEGGRMDVVDTSGAVTVLSDYTRQLLARLSTNSRLPEAVLGRIKPSEVPSGIALALSFGPLQTMVDEMRLVRAEKYALLLKFVQRFYQSVNKIERGAQRIFPAEVTFGTYLPQDRKAAVEEVTELLQAKAVSKMTAIRLLIAAGFSIDDASEEVRRIEQEDVEGAVALLDATGNEDAVAERLGVESGRAPEPPVPTVP